MTAEDPKTPRSRPSSGGDSQEEDAREITKASTGQESPDDRDRATVHRRRSRSSSRSSSSRSSRRSHSAGSSSRSSSESKYERRSRQKTKSLREWKSSRQPGVVSAVLTSLARLFGGSTETLEKRFGSVAAGAGGVLGILISILIPKRLRQVRYGRSKKAKKIGRKVGAFTDSFEKRFAKSTLGFLEVFGFLAAILVPRFVRQRFSKSSKAISKGTSKFFKRLGQGFDKWADRYLPAPLVKSIRAATRTVRRTRKGATKFAASWLKSRDYVKLAWSLPAAMMLLPVFTTLTLAFAHTDADKITHYQLAESEANIEGKIELVHLFRRRLEQLGFHREESSEYEEALRAAKISGFEMAYKRMKLLAPLPLEANSASDANDDSTVFVEPKSLYPPAHLWIAGALMQGNVSIGTAEENWKRAHDHVQHVLSHNANDPTAQFYEIKIAEHEGKSFIKRRGKSVFQLKKALVDEGGYRQFAADLMRDLKKNNDLNRARHYASKYISFIETVDVDQRSAGQWIALVEAYVLLNDELKAFESADAAKGLLEHANVSSEQSEFLTTLVTAKNTTQISRLKSQLAADDPEILALVEETLNLDPENDFAVTELGRKLAYHNKQGNITKIVRRLLEKQKLSARVPLIAGDTFVSLRLWDQALEQYENAMTLDPQMGRPYNNLAFIWSTAPPADFNSLLLGPKKRLEKALEYANQAISRDPDSDFFETRGQILMQLERWLAAADDLERALNGILDEETKRDAHESLVVIYKKLQRPEMAAAHQQHVH